MMESLRLFGVRIAVKPHAVFAIHCLSQVNPAVRTACVDYLGTLYEVPGFTLARYLGSILNLWRHVGTLESALA